MKLSLCFLCLFISLLYVSNVVNGYDDERGYGYGEGEDQGEGGKGQGDIFVLPKAKEVMRGEAGEFSVVRGFAQRGGIQSPMHIGFINMEPKSLFLPQYLDSSLILFVRRGKAKIGLILEDGLVEKNLKIGDVYRVPAGSTFYLSNTGEGQILQIICSIDTSESLKMGDFQSFFVAGGTSPVSILTGFDHKTLQTAFNVTMPMLEEILTAQQRGSFVFANVTHEKLLASVMKLKQKESLYSMEDDDEEEDKNKENALSSWTWRKLMNFVVGDNAESPKSTDAYNLIDKNADFENKYGSSRAITEKDYAPLGRTGSTNGIGVYLVNLTAGAMMAPHINPTATEFGIVLRGSGKIQVGFPNGSPAATTVVNEGDVFWVPRYFPFCQIASRSGPFEFFGFTTSARKNRPQFLAGATSILQTMKGPELAAAFGVSEDKFGKFVNAQGESIILPSASAAPPHEHEPPRKEGEGEEKEHRHGGDGPELIKLWN
ncbi:hypothetical protein ACHQM5_021821 [Ranunculus cassubicifolius]